LTPLTDTLILVSDQLDAQFLL